MIACSGWKELEGWGVEGGGVRIELYLRHHVGDDGYVTMGWGWGLEVELYLGCHLGDGWVGLGWEMDGMLKGVGWGL